MTDSVDDIDLTSRGGPATSPERRRGLRAFVWILALVVFVVPAVVRTVTLRGLSGGGSGPMSWAVDAFTVLTTALPAAVIIAARLLDRSKGRTAFWLAATATVGWVGLWTAAEVDQWGRPVTDPFILLTLNVASALGVAFGALGFLFGAGIAMLLRRRRS